MRDEAAIIYAAFAIFELESAPQGKGITEQYQRQRSSKKTWLEWSINITRLLPEDKTQVVKIFDFARGVREPCGVVRKFLQSVPEAVWEEGRKIAEVI